MGKHVTCQAGYEYTHIHIREALYTAESGTATESPSLHLTIALYLDSPQKRHDSSTELARNVLIFLR
jgi:hypothetical protein